ncbi:helix-turn-helix domain-containing protein [Actinocorallia sp. A-T 12471]|uniref:TetR/AcrR family transcriptional regulator n=1 Tax=Actinocorallia sp. A-T 12471 TaxID=3089813 RepID=UPI0029CFA25B|nr:helix-turn-helix domain-containing protein [Actinocorallia sp. A-T 12471]MDX6744671.1 helix-turn-helix domain-containing protein [Actinocorallia sp. A-T 12471]
MAQDVPFGKPRAERADAARNREHLLRTAREMIAEHGTEKVTMDALAERSGLGKGTVFRRFGTRAGIFTALLDEDERRFQQRVLSGPPPLGPGAPPRDRIIAYGRARMSYLYEHHVIARATLHGARPVPMGGASITHPHLRMLLARTDLPAAILDALVLQLTAALEGPTFLYVSAGENADSPTPAEIEALSTAWHLLIDSLLPPP